MNIAGTRRREFCNSSHVRTTAQSRAYLEPSRARVPHMAGCEFSTATVLRASALRSKRSRSLAAYGAARLTAQRRTHRDLFGAVSPSELAAPTATPQELSITCRPGRSRQNFCNQSYVRTTSQYTRGHWMPPARPILKQRRCKLFSTTALRPATPGRYPACFQGAYGPCQTTAETHLTSTTNLSEHARPSYSEPRLWILPTASVT